MKRILLLIQWIINHDDAQFKGTGNKLPPNIGQLFVSSTFKLTEKLIAL